jgi:hypothetical protein
MRRMHQLRDCLVVAIHVNTTTGILLFLMGCNNRLLPPQGKELIASRSLGQQVFAEIRAVSDVISVAV